MKNHYKGKFERDNSFFLESGLLSVVILLLITFFGPFDLNYGFGQLAQRQVTQQSFAQEIAKPKNEKIVFEDASIAIEKIGSGFLVTIKTQDVAAARIKAQSWFVENQKTNKLCDLKINFVLGKDIEVPFRPELSVPDGCQVPQRPKPPANVDLNRQPNPQSK